MKPHPLGAIARGYLEYLYYDAAGELQLYVLAAGGREGSQDRQEFLEELEELRAEEVAGDLPPGTVEVRPYPKHHYGPDGLPRSP